MTMPKAPMNEYRQFVARQDDIWRSRQALDIDAIPQVIAQLLPAEITPEIPPPRIP